MTRNQKIGLGVLTLSPIVLFIFYFIAIFSTIFGVVSAAESGVDPDPSGFIGSIISVFGIIGLILLLTFGLMVYYLIHITRNPRIESNMQIVWILLVVFAGLVGNMVYWFVHIWNVPEDEYDGEVL